MSEQHENDHSDIKSSDQSSNQSSNSSMNQSAQSQSSDSSKQPNDTELRAAVLSLLQDADLNTITPKAIRASMEEHFDCSMDERKAFIKQIAADFVADQQPAEVDVDDQPTDEPVDQEEQDRVMAEELQLQLGGRPRRSTAAQPAKPKKKRPALNNPRPKRPPPEVSFSPALLQFLGDETPVTRGEVTKRIWAYIKENNLQNESNKRKIIVDEQLSTLFGNRKTIDMFKMTQSLAKHMKSTRDLAG